MDAWKAFDPEKILGAAETTILYDMQDTEVRRLHGVEDRVSISLDELPSYVPLSFVAAEDARFFSHRGVDLIRIAGAAWADIKAGSYVQGASTISQQLIKLSHLSSEKTMSRKLEEAILAYKMEQQYSKEEILTMYLNYVYFGGGYYGIEAASQGYFGIHARELELSQAALLAGVLKSPSKYAPHLDMNASKTRRNVILGLMCDYGYISEKERDEGREAPVRLVKREQSEIRYADYTDTAIREAQKILGLDAEALHSGGYRIYTALDTKLQNACDSILADESYFPDADVQSALVVQRTNTGLVCAMLGGRKNTRSMSFNRATELRRQPGSVIKPILCYAPALENGGYTAATMLLDTQTVFQDYAPSNYGDKYYGWVTMREAVTRSLNIPAVKVLSQLGVDNAMSFAEQLGIEFHEQDASLALALGGFTYGVSPWMITGAYNCFASGGRYYAPTVVRKITDTHGSVLYEYQDLGKQLLSEQNAYILTSMLQSVVKEGTGRRLGALEIDIAGKTGTVEDETGNRDAWMAAYNPEYSASVWIGYDNASKGSLPEAATGGKYPALILCALYGKIYERREAPEFSVPNGIVEAPLDRHSLYNTQTLALAGLYAPQSSVLKEIFAQGTQPTARSDYWSAPLPPSDFTLLQGGSGYPVLRFVPRQKHTDHWIYRENEGMQNICIAVIPAGEASEYTDTQVSPGESYAYSVRAVHPEGAKNGLVLESAPTQALSIEVSSFRKEPNRGTASSSGGILDFSSISANKFE